MADPIDVVARIILSGEDQTKPAFASVKAGIADVVAATQSAAAASQGASAKELSFWQISAPCADGRDVVCLRYVLQ